MATPPGRRKIGREAVESRTVDSRSNEALAHGLRGDAPLRGASSADVSPPAPQRGGSGSSAGGRRLRRRLLDRGRPPSPTARGRTTGDRPSVRPPRSVPSGPSLRPGPPRDTSTRRKTPSRRRHHLPPQPRLRTTTETAGQTGCRPCCPARAHRPQVDRPHLRRQLPGNQRLEDHQGAQGVRRIRHLLRNRPLSGSGPRPGSRDCGGRVRGGRPHTQSLQLPHPLETRAEDRDRQRYRSLSGTYRRSHRAPLSSSGRLHRRQDL